jgi:hypothetical protein
VFFGVLCLFGCTRTAIGGYSESPDKSYCVYGKVYGAYGRSFLDNTDKKIKISIAKGNGTEKLLFLREYRVHGADVGWNAMWNANTNVTVVVFEYPAGVNRWDLSSKQGPTNHLRTLTYDLDSKTETFVERPTK